MIKEDLNNIIDNCISDYYHEDIQLTVNGENILLNFLG